jgi:uncharacterized protein with HEPN domain
MTQRDLLDFLLDIIEAIDEIESFVVGINFKEFASNREKILAVVKLLEIIGEATKKIPEDLRDQYPDIPWRAVAGMRDVLVHQYWQVDVEVIWETVVQSLPLLKVVISEMIKSNSSDSPSR